MNRLELSDEQANQLWIYLYRERHSRQKETDMRRRDVEARNVAGAWQYPKAEAEFDAWRRICSTLDMVMHKLAKPEEAGPEESELDIAARERAPVLYDGAEYIVTAIIKRYRKDKPFAQVELLDKCGHSVIVARPDQIRIKERGKR